jgi:hypothetical protein
MLLDCGVKTAAALKETSDNYTIPTPVVVVVVLAPT